MTSVSSPFPAQFQALLGSQGAAGFFATLSASQGGDGGADGASSSPFGALLAQYIKTGQVPAQSPAGADLSAFAMKFAQLGGDLAALKTAIGQLSADGTQKLSSKGDAQGNIPSALLALLAKAGATPFAPSVAGDADGTVIAKEGADIPNEHGAEASVDATDAVASLAALAVAIPRDKAAPDMASADTPEGAGTGKTDNSVSAAKNAATNAASDALATATADASPENPKSADAGSGAEADPAKTAKPESAADPRSVPRNERAELVAAAHDSGILGVDLARVVGGRAKAAGQTPGASDETAMDLLPSAASPNAATEAADAPPSLAERRLPADPAAKGKASIAAAHNQQPSATATGATADAGSTPTQKSDIGAPVPEAKQGADLKPLPPTGGFDKLLPDSSANSSASPETAPGVSSPLTHTAFRPTVTLTPGAPLAAHIAGQLAVHITQAARDGQNEFKIRLDPPELGRVDVKLEVGDDGRVQAVLAADNEKTLHLFERHQGILERALQEAGLKADSGSLSFTLSGGGNQAASDQPQSRGNGQGFGRDPGLPLAQQEKQIIAVASMSDRALDIRV